MNIALYFGSFNPIHIGHLIIANTIVQNEHVDKVWFVVSPQNPFKKSNSLLSEFDRLDLVREAIDSNDRLGVTDVEFNMPKPSYTIDTLTYLKEKHPNYNFSLIIGEDNLKSFPKWKNYEQILLEHSVLVYPRPSSVNSNLRNHVAIKMIDAPLLDISATFIREAIRKGRDIQYLVPEKVKELIEARKLFK